MKDNEAFKTALDDLSGYLVEILNEKEAVTVSHLLGSLIRAMGYEPEV